MNVKSVLNYIRNMKDRDGAMAIINAAESRSALLSNIDNARNKKLQWGKVEKLGLKVGDMVFIHTGPRVEKNNAGHELLNFTGRKHENMWGRPLTIKAIKSRKKEIKVKIAGKGECKLSPFECVTLKLSKDPTAEALAIGLMTRIAPKKGTPVSNIKWPTSLQWKQK